MDGEMGILGLRLSRALGISRMDKWDGMRYEMRHRILGGLIGIFIDSATHGGAYHF